MLGVVFLIVIALLSFWRFRRYVETFSYDSAEALGEAGEALSRYCLGKAFADEPVYILNDLLVEDKAGKSTQIDHLILTRSGFFVVETKNIRGFIYADLSAQRWRVWRYKRQYTMQNPYRQNMRHIYVLSEVTRLPIKAFASIVFFINEDCTVKTRGELPCNLCTSVSEIYSYVHSYKTEKYDDAFLLRMATYLKRISFPNTTNNKKEHIRRLYETH